MMPLLGSLPIMAHLALTPWIAPRPADSTNRIVVLRDVTLIDGTGAQPAPHMVVEVEHGRIRSITPLGRFRVPAGAQVVSGSGKFLIPGLWDMHVHMSSAPVSPVAHGPASLQENSRYYLPLFVAWGVTGVRDMSGHLELLTAWRDSIRAGQLLGPRMVVTGQKLGSPEPAVPGAPYPLRTDADVRETVRMLRRDGADFVKIGALPGKFLPAVANESWRQGFAFVGHLAEGVSLGEASRLGQRSVEHLDGALLALSSRESELRARLRRLGNRWTYWAVRLGLVDRERSRLALQRDILSSQDPQRATDLYALLVRNGTWQVPTLSGTRDVLRVVEPEPFADQRAAYLPPLRLPVGPNLWQKDPAVARQTLTRELAVVGEMFRAGVLILAGTDLPGADRIPGFSLVEELELLVRAGLSPMAALQAATREPARFLGLADSLGTIEPSKVADLVLLDADPLLDIRNVHHVRAVVLRGTYLSPQRLDSLRASVRHLMLTWQDTLNRKHVD